MALVASELVVGEVLKSSSTQYVIQEFICDGAFGKVAKCLDLCSRKTVAVKVMKLEDAVHEIYLLQILNQLNADQVNMVKLYEWFLHLDVICLVFEMLDKDYLDLVITQKFRLKCVDHIRPIAKQLLVALEALQSHKIIHAGIKPKNIMLISMKDNPHRVKLIDFQAALRSDVAQLPVDVPQSVGYQAPEMALGLPYSEAIDMWGLGCSLAFLYLGYDLFPVDCEYLMMKQMVEMVGMPLNNQLQNGLNTKRFFCKEEDTSGSRWRLWTPEEFRDVNGITAEEWPKDCLTSLNQLVNPWDEGEAAEKEDKMAFLDLLKNMLQMDEMKRITPTDALQHPFITMTHLSEDTDSRDYLTRAQAIMDTSSMEVSPKRLSPSLGGYFTEKRNEELQLSATTNQCGRIATAYVTEDQDKELLITPFITKDFGLHLLREQPSHYMERPVQMFVSRKGIEIKDDRFPVPKRTKFSGRVMKNVRKFFASVRTTFSCNRSFPKEN